MFDEYCNKLSLVFTKQQADVNLVMVGAFMNDSAIRNLFLSNLNWRAAFIEPIDSNIHNLKLFLSNHSALDRGYFIKAATMYPCVNPNFSIDRLSENARSHKNAAWLPWGVASPVRNADRSDWVSEVVNCQSGAEIIRGWTGVLYNQKTAKKNKLRPHVLRINADDFNFEVHDAATLFYFMCASNF